MGRVEALIPLPLGERWLGEAESVRGISPLSLCVRKHPPHPALRATFSPRGRRIEGSASMETAYGHA